METHTLVSSETARQQVYNGLAQCWHIPDTPMGPVLSVLVNHLTVLDSAAVEPLDRLKPHAAEKHSPASLKPEFTRLFVGPFHPPCPPYGSVYIEKTRTLMGDSTMDALSRYRDLGVDLDRDFREAPDHICAELEFMCLLVYKELTDIRFGDPGKAEQMLAHQLAFLDDHLNRWIPPFTDRVAAHAHSRFYKELARATAVFVAEDRRYLAGIAPPAEPCRGEIGQKVPVPVWDVDLPDPTQIKVTCTRCGQVIRDGREIETQGRIFCKPCAGNCYFSHAREVAWPEMN